MTISVRGVNNAAGQGAGSAAASTVSITPTLPGSAAAGDRIYVYAVGNTTSGSTPSNWTVVGTKDTILGSGTPASGSGRRQATWYYRDYDGVWSMPAWTQTSTANNTHWIGAVAITPTSGYSFDTPTITTVGGSYNSASTSYTDSSAASFTTHSGALLLVGTGIRSNTTSSAAALSQSGATFGTVTERCDGGNSTGFSVSGKVHTAPVTTGASATITHTETLAGSTQGETLIVEQTESVIVLPGPKIATLTDDFNTGSTPDSGKWSITSGSPTLSSGELQMPASARLDSLVTYDLTGSSFYFQVKAIPAVVYVMLYQPGASLYGWQFSSGSANAYAGLTNPSSRTHTSGDWYRVSESSGTISHDYSTDGTNWTNLTSNAATGGAYISLPLVFFSSGGSGTTVFDNFNFVPPPPSNTNLFFSMF